MKLCKCNVDHLERTVGDTLNSYNYFISHHPYVLYHEPFIKAPKFLESLRS